MRATRRAARTPVVPVRGRAGLVLGLASVAGLAMFVWPLLLQPGPGVAHDTDAPFVFVLIIPVLIGVVLGELAGGRLDAKAIAMLGVLSAVGAALRPLGAGTAGIELVFFLLVLGGRVFGPGFGFVLGSTTLFASALVTGGVGPWLPFQMLASSWIGLGAGLLPRRLRGRWEVGVLALYGAASAYAYGFLLNLWFWPFSLGTDTQLSFVPGDAVLSNLRRFFLFTIGSSSLGWDTGRAVTNLVSILVVGPAVLVTLRRAARRAAFGAPVRFVAAGPSTVAGVEVGPSPG